MKMPLGIEVGLSPGDVVLDGDPAALRKTGLSPQFSAHVYCSQTVAHLSYCGALFTARRYMLTREACMLGF